MGKKGLLGLIGAIVLLVGGLAFNVMKRGSSDDEDLQPPVKILFDYPNAAKPTGTLQVTLTRFPSTLAKLADMNDRGDLLYLTKSEKTSKEYTHEYQGKEVEKRSVSQDRSFYLCPDGGLVTNTSQPAAERNFSPRLPFGDDQGQPVTLEDSSLLVVRRKFDSKLGKDHYAIDKETQLPLKPKKLETDSKPVNGPYQPESVSGGGGFIGTFPPLAITIKEIYRSNIPTTLKDRSESGTLWISEDEMIRSKIVQRLFCIKGNVKESIEFPPGYKVVLRVANTGDQVAATFGQVGQDKPTRSFTKTGKVWKELPIPDGFIFSFVQKIFDDGTILGFVTTGDSSGDHPVADSKSIRQVVWRGDACTILNELPNWPKQGIVSMILLANRKGDIYVRSFLNTQTNASEFYLLNVSVKP